MNNDYGFCVCVCVSVWTFLLWVPFFILFHDKHSQFIAFNLFPRVAPWPRPDQSEACLGLLPEPLEKISFFQIASLGPLAVISLTMYKESMMKSSGPLKKLKVSYLWVKTNLFFFLTCFIWIFATCFWRSPHQYNR